MTLRRYTGKKQPRPKNALTHYQPIKPFVNEAKLSPYLPSEELVEAVNLALTVERPLLLQGEPGCGKTRLAEMVAFELELPYFAWHVQSTTKAKDGLYSYDALHRLHDVQMSNRDINIFSKHDPKKPANPANLDDYIDYGPLGQAFRHSQEKRPVILIDEIDKADIDFPNDLLLALDESHFMVTELGLPIEATHKPIIFITSNEEKRLPDAFLRRCLFFYIDLPPKDEARFDYFKKIVELHRPPQTQRETDLITQAINRFVKLRREMEEKSSGKKVSTSELLDWYIALLQNDEALDRLTQGELPFAEALLKTRLDWKFRSPSAPQM